MYRFNVSEVYIKKENGKIILSEKPQKTWAEIFKDFSGDPDFSAGRETLKDKPRKVESVICLLDTDTAGLRG